MRFKIKNINVRISFSFPAFILLFIVTEKISFFLMSLLSAFVHECVHIFFIYFFGGRISSFSISALGGSISRKNTIALSELQEAVINISAPVFNIVFGLVLLFFAPQFTMFSYVNLIMGVFNILPFYSFDGGVFLKYILLSCTNEKNVDSVVMFVSLIITACFSFFSLYIFLVHSQSILPFIFSLFMILSIIFKK